MSDLSLHLSLPQSFTFLHCLHSPVRIVFDPSRQIHAAQEEVMKFANINRMMPVLGVLSVVAAVAPYAHAGCGQYRPASLNISPQHYFASPYLLQASLSENEENYREEPTIVGTWKEHWISEGSEGIRNGTEIDAGYSQWHSDHTEENLSGLRAPLTGNVCYGVWEQTGPSSYRMNHFGISYDPTGEKLVGPARIQQWLTLEDKGQKTSGKFTIDQYDEAGNLLAHIQGKIIGTRVTMDTGF
jgi:hypothetical protein